MTTLPVPVRFELPGPQWRAVEPGSLGVSNAAFLAVRDGLDGDFSPTLSISGGWRTDGASLALVADESLEVLRMQATDVELVKRTEMGSPEAPAITQSLGAVAEVDGSTFDLRQAQVVMGPVDLGDRTRRAVLLFTLTCTYRHFTDLGPEFQAFMASVELHPGDGVVSAGDGPR